jgi:hypothetical protein
MLAFTNAALFHAGVFRSAAAWDSNVSTPPAARTHALVSLLLWIGVVSCGRLIAYV